MAQQDQWVLKLKIKMKKRSKRYRDLLNQKKNISKKRFKIDEAIENIKKTKNIKFDESIDVSIMVSLKQSKGGDFSLRSSFNLPNGNGKKIKVAVICESDKTEIAKSSGADFFDSDEILKKISLGKFDFDKLICTPGMMNKIGKFGKILGPKGLMPNPKLGTVSNDVKKTVNDIKKGMIEVKNDKDGNIGVSIGRKSFSKEKLIENYKNFVDFVKKEKSTSIKGEFIKGIYLTSTMGVSYRIN